MSAVYAVHGCKKGDIVKPKPNTNLMALRTLLPIFRMQLAPSRRALCCAVYAPSKAEVPTFDQIPKSLCRN